MKKLITFLILAIPLAVLSQQTGNFISSLQVINADTIIDKESGSHPIDAVNKIPFRKADYLSFNENKSVENEEIALVTTLVIDENTQFNVVVWERKANAGISHYNIYKQEKDQDEFIKIGELPFFQISVFIDSNSRVGQEEEAYKISSVDAFGNESELSPPHKTMNLGLSQDSENKINLSWIHYKGFDFGAYKIYRGTSPDNMELLEEIDKGSEDSQTYVDDPPPGTYYYQVRIDLPRIIDPTKFKSTATYSQVHSNMEKKLKSGTQIQTSRHEKGFKIYPNPFKDEINIETNGDYEYLKIINVNGKTISHKKIESNEFPIDLKQLKSGLYFIKFIGNDIVSVARIVKM